MVSRSRMSVNLAVGLGRASQPGTKPPATPEPIIVMAYRVGLKPLNERTGMAAKFEIFDDKGGKYHFHLKAPNGENHRR
jgi:hypothetical protein